MASHAGTARAAGGQTGGVIVVREGIGSGLNTPDGPALLIVYNEANALNRKLMAYFAVSILALLAIMLVRRIFNQRNKYIRTVSSLEGKTQRYFAATSGTDSFFKKHVLYAPIFNKRVNREFRVGTSLNAGTLPTRLQFAFVAAYIGVSALLCVLYIDWSVDASIVCALLRNRTGTMATFNIIPLILTAGRNNPLIPILGMSFDTFNLFHRWFGRIVAMEALAHMILFFVPVGELVGEHLTLVAAFEAIFVAWGFFAAVFFLTIFVQSLSIFRHVSYETFKILHILLSIGALVTLFYHVKLQRYWQTDFLYPSIAMWILDHIARAARVIYRNFGAGGTEMLVESLPGNCVRVTVTLARPWMFKPGQHAYVYMPSLSYWQSHPFTVAWSDAHGAQLDIEKADELDVTKKTTMSFLVRGQKGFTGKLCKKAAESKEGRMTVRGFLEGPYGGLHDMRSYGTVVLFGGGVGITDPLPHVRDILEKCKNGTSATRKAVLVWITKEVEHIAWIRPWLAEIAAMEMSHEVLRIKIFVSSSQSTEATPSPSEIVQIFPGRPDINSLLGSEMENQIGTLGVSVCGPGALSDEVRLAVRSRQHQGNIDYMEEAFSW
ncbi:ferric reductase like transmembrane component-domain-containing protein [Xylogone sp. PMI_703]|nr:ferric reductase like transmembrane component-domain-containing protein [Xylogone sp. PMI_703]